MMDIPLSLDFIAQLHTRVRSSINVIDESIYFSSGNTVYQLRSDGDVVNKWTYPKAFFFGTIDIIDGCILTLGTLCTKEGTSGMYLFSFERSGRIAYKTEICESPIISSDTSGIWWKKNIGFIGGNNSIICLRASDGRTIWQAPVPGFASRQIVTGDEERIFFTTQQGYIGALNQSDGSLVWKIRMNDQFLVTPPSVSNSSVLVIADAHLVVIDKVNGSTLQKIPVGHSPYSMVSLFKDKILIGAGEPPHHGLLFSLELTSNGQQDKYRCIQHASNAFVEAGLFNLTVEIYGTGELVVDAVIDGDLFRCGNICGRPIGPMIFSYQIPIPTSIAPGEYVVPIFLFSKTRECFVRPLCIQLHRKEKLPSKVILRNIPQITQSDPLLSGAALVQLIKNMYCDSVTQEDVREMIQYSKGMANYPSFQTWRILLRRILTSSAKRKEELPEYQSCRE